MSETPTLDRLNKSKDQYNALMEFLEEFLPGEQISLYQYRTGLTDSRPCSGSSGSWLDFCRWKEDGDDCAACNNTGLIEIEIEDRDLPYSGSKQDLVYKFLGIDPKEVEKERRAILAALAG